MKKSLTIYLTALLLVGLFAAPLSFAQDGAGGKETTGRDRAQELKNRRDAVTNDLMEKRNELKTNLQEKREEAKEEFAAAREEFKADLKALRDEQKQQIIRQVDDRLQELNTMKTDLLMQHLDRIAEIVTTITEKAADLPGDTETVDQAAADAHDAIEAAEQAIAEQAGKEYIIEIGDETQLRGSVQKIVQQFRSDMKSTIMAVREAHRAAIQAARALAGARGEQDVLDEPEVTEEETTEATESADTE